MKNKKILIIIALLLIPTIGVLAESLINSNQVIYDNTDSGSQYNTVQDALDDLYNKVGNTGGSNSGYTISFDSQGGSSVSDVNAINITGNPPNNLPIPIREGYYFLGWYTDPNDGEIVTSNTSVSDSTQYYAHWEEHVSFASDSWPAIVYFLSQDRNIYDNDIGQTKEIEMDMNNDGIKESYTVRLANTSTPQECSGNDFSKTSCGVVIEFVDTVATNLITVSDTYNAWSSCLNRTYVNETVYNALPLDVKSVIIVTNPVISNQSYNPWINRTSNDKLFLLSTKEVGFDYNNDSQKDKTRTLDYYVSKSSSYKVKKNIQAQNENWFLRSTDDTYNCNSCVLTYVNTSGYIGTASGYSNEMGIAPAFRIFE